MNLRRVAGWAFRLYLLALIAGVLVLAIWLIGGLPGFSGEVAMLWYGVAGVGAVVLSLLIAVRVVGS